MDLELHTSVVNSQDVQSVIWTKLLVNAGINPLASILDRPESRMRPSTWRRETHPVCVVCDAGRVEPPHCRVGCQRSRGGRSSRGHPAAAAWEKPVGVYAGRGNRDRDQRLLDAPRYSSDEANGNWCHQRNGRLLRAAPWHSNADEPAPGAPRPWSRVALGRYKTAM